MNSEVHSSHSVLTIFCFAGQTSYVFMVLPKLSFTVFFYIRKIISFLLIRNYLIKDFSSDQQLLPPSPANVLVAVLTILSVQNCLSFINIPLIWNVHVDLKFSDSCMILVKPLPSRDRRLFFVEMTLEKSWEDQGRKEEWNRVSKDLGRVF